MLSEYGEQKSLQEILEELAVYCSSNFAQSYDIRVILPKNAVDAYNYSLKSKGMIVLTGKDLAVGPLTTQFTSSGAITIHTIEDNEEVIKELK